MQQSGYFVDENRIAAPELRGAQENNRAILDAIAIITRELEQRPVANGGQLRRITKEEHLAFGKLASVMYLQVGQNVGNIALMYNATSGK